MENLEIYNKVRAVPQDAQKDFNNGKFKGTDINPMWRIEKLTEVFGPCGFGWYYTIDREWAESTDAKETAVYVDISLYVKLGEEWSKPIKGTGGNTFSKLNKDGDLTFSDEAYKMALTDALSVACKMLGVGADIYYNKSETKYTKKKEVAVSPSVTTPSGEEDKKAKVLSAMRKAMESSKDSDSGNKIIAVCKAVNVQVSFGMKEATKYHGGDLSKLEEKELKSIYNAIYLEATK